MPTSSIDLDLLLKLRLTVARFGEMDLARWWNTKGQLGPTGVAALRRGFPRTFRFAQARSTFAVASKRCQEVFDPPKCVTLWHLPDAIEEAFDANWEHWLDSASDWEDFFFRLERPVQGDLFEMLESRGLAGAGDRDRLLALRRSAEGRAVQLPGQFEGTNDDLRGLALAFGRGEAGELAVPYVRRADA